MHDFPGKMAVQEIGCYASWIVRRAKSGRPLYHAENAMSYATEQGVEQHACRMWRYQVARIQANSLFEFLERRGVAMRPKI